VDGVAVNFINAMLVFVDGPYGLNKYPGDRIRTAQSTELYQAIFLKAAAVCTGHLVVCGTFDSLAWIHEHLMPSDWIYRSVIVWHKPDWVGGAVKNIKTFSPRYELLAHYSKRSATFYADAVRVPYGDRALKGVRKKAGQTCPWVPNPLGARRGDVWSIVSQRLKRKKKGRTERQQHGCQKPDELLEVLLLAMTKLGDAVVEPFVGSDNLQRLTQELGRQYIGFERAEDLIKGITTFSEER